MGRNSLSAGGITAWISVATFLSGCEILPFTYPDTATRTQLETIPYVAMARSALWVRAPTALTASTRALPGFIEQRAVFDNNTVLTGDNFMLLQALSAPDLADARFSYAAFRRRVATLPAPFGDLDTGNLLTGTDALGPYFWAEERLGATTLCVLGLRRLTSGMRQIPQGYDAIDLMLRNCTTGDITEALAPMRAASVSGFLPLGPEQTGDDDRMMSPLAAPTPQ